MKKMSYALIGFMAGAVVMFSTSALADNIQTLVGKKVTKEYQVKINNNAISDKAIAIDGKTYLPVRKISNELGAAVTVDNDNISITTGGGKEQPSSPVEATSDYSNESVTSLNSLIETTKTRLQLDKEQKERVQEKIEQAKKDNFQPAIDEQSTKLKAINERIDKFNKDIQEIEAELKTRK
ncbi:stalk domain-containing protein [Paenibacillus terrigena]|uniref:stalk domain-containing protein n=1 Tax=Paenibacillus terrigena TaxID=369333 RepID=UPI0028D113F1|nr:hypothetical protein [Paenibacillus terrigena]